MIINWAGEGSDVIIALTKDIHPDENSTSNVYISSNYGGSFSLVHSLQNATIDKYYNSHVLKNHVSISHCVCVRQMDCHIGQVIVYRLYTPKMTISSILCLKNNYDHFEALQLIIIYSFIFWLIFFKR